ncbi:unnamed protein product [Adineta steineri]|uniref:ADP-ribosylation factor n=1 Tax=Adineta steineri TaxID=433720 RepID=A0A815QJP4_9BILA|nr:unnamed protein product [Adineta steineri]CAF1464188.1 unnamed protein product [Adineta steineri]CAF4042827.1 unnamed protein product [Adineta steineri]CAF4129702.1 unnamed protein product [Adineta steineri]
MKEAKILMVGLDGAGKTIILYRLKLEETITSISTIGFNAETINYKNISFTIWDVGGLIFVVDSNDRERIGETSEELQRMLEDDELKRVSLLIFANKQDISNVMNTTEITEKLDLHSLSNRNWYIQTACAISGDGLGEGLDWL